jgi:site-specific DNA-methyltransferase (adenine-specific)
MADGHLVKWQKPLALFSRIVLPYTDEGDSILDCFMGSGTLGEWCKKNNRNFVGIELNKEIFDLAKQRIETP